MTLIISVKLNHNVSVKYVVGWTRPNITFISYYNKHQEIENTVCITVHVLSKS